MASSLRTTKPLPGAHIAWGHPLTRDLAYCLLFNEGSGIPVDLCSVNQRNVLIGVPTWKGTEEGPGFATTGGTGVSIRPTHLIPLAERIFNSSITADLTVRVIHRPTSLATTVAIFNKQDDAGAEVAIFTDTSGNINFSFIGQQSVGGFTTLMTAGSIWDFIMTRRGTTVSVYVNGRFISASTSITGFESGSVDGSGPSNSYLKLGVTPAYASTNHYDGSFLHMAAWQRGMTPEEVSQMYSDRYAYISRKSVHLGVLSQAAGAGGIPVINNPLLIG